MPRTKKINPEKMTAKQRERYERLEAARERKRNAPSEIQALKEKKETRQLYREEHKEEIAERHKAYYQEHKEEIAEKKRQWYEKSKEKRLDERCLPGTSIIIEAPQEGYHATNVTKVPANNPLMFVNEATVLTGKRVSQEKTLDERPKKRHWQGNHTALIEGEARSSCWAESIASSTSSSRVAQEEERRKNNSMATDFLRE